MTTKFTFLRSLILFFIFCISFSIYAQNNFINPDGSSSNGNNNYIDPDGSGSNGNNNNEVNKCDPLYQTLAISSISSTYVKCPGEATGSINIKIEGGETPYTVTPTDPDFNGDISILDNECKITNLQVGSYGFIIMDANGCTINTTQTIEESAPALKYEPKTNNVVCPGTATGKVFGEATGGVPAYTYTLTGEDVEYHSTNSNGRFPDLYAGKYTASMTDANGCTVVADPIEITEKEILTVDPLKAKPAANVTCATDKTASVTFTVAGRTEVVAVSDTARYYSVKLFDITNQHEILAPDLKFSNKFHPVITENKTKKVPVLDENGEPTLDENGEIITKNVTYKDTLWTEGCYEPTKVEEVRKVSHKEYTEDLRGFNCDDKITVSGLGAGAYKIRFYRGDCEFGEEMTFTVGITGSLPTAQINNVESFCDGSEYTITPTIVANPGISKYEWMLDDEVLANTKEVTRIFTTEDHNKALKLNVTNRCGSSTSNIVLVKVNKRPTATIQTNTDICRSPQSEVSISFTGKGPFTYVLQDGTEKTTTDIIVKEAVSPDSDITFTLTSLKDQNCESIAEDINTVEAKQPDVLSIEPLKSTPAANVVCDTDKTASVSFTIAGRTSLVASADTASYYSVKLFDINKQQEIADTELKFTYKFHPVITKNRVEKEPVLDENVTYKDTLWTEGCHEPTKLEEVRMVSHKEYTEDLKGFDCNDKITVSGLGAGAYSISFFKGECAIAESITFTVGITGSLPSAYINEVGSFCNDTEVTITPMIESNPAVTKYEWLLGEEVVGETKDLTRAFVLDENNKTLKLTVTNKCGVTTSNSVLVQVNPRPTAVLETSKDFLCKNQPTEVSITLTGEGPFTYILPDGTEKTVEDVFSKEEIIPSKDTVFTFISLKDANCEANVEIDINTAETKIYPEPEYDMTITVPEPMVSGRYVIVNATEGFENYTLSINDENVPAKGPNNLFWAKKFPFGISTNEFKMTITDENGCEWVLEDTKIIESTIFPNIFTPNGDGVNDVFLADYDLKVYDRQGTLMYEGTSGWNGTHNGVEANQGVYLYTVFIPTEDGNLEVIKSTLTLER